ncbi:MAG: hypothetical protein ACTHJI_12150 [Leifsonia sp.]
MRSRNPFVPAAIVAALTIGSLAACSSNGNSNYVTPQTASSSSSSSSSGGSSEAATPEALPSDFPKNDVPIIDGTIVVARGDKVNGWSVTVQPSGKTGFADAKSALEGKGYKVQPGATDKAAVYTNGTYTVGLKTPGVSVTYNVTATQ